MRTSPRFVLVLALACVSLAGATVTHARTRSTVPVAQSPSNSPLPVILAPPANDVCATAITLGCGTFYLSGNSTEANNDYTFPSHEASCTGFVANGRDVVYKIVAAPGDSLWVDYTSALDASIYVVTDCADPTNTCVAGEDSTDVGGVETLRYKFASGGTYYMILDHFGDNSGGTWTANGQVICVTTPPPPSNDRCTTPSIIGCGPINRSGSTEFAVNDYQFPSVGSSCAGSLAEGKDVVYRMNVVAGDRLVANYTSTGDGVMYCVFDCDDVDISCAVGVDATGTGQTETLDFIFNFSGTYYLILDNEGANSFGLFTLTGNYYCVTAPNDQCHSAIPIPCGPINLQGSTQFANNNYQSTDALSCTGFPSEGRDVAYRIDAHAGDALNVTYTSSADGSVYIVSDCLNVAGSCLTGKDMTTQGEPEVLQYTFPASGIYYLILDSFGANTFGTWSLVGNLSCVTTGVQDPARVFALGSIDPNPFGEATSIRYSLGARGRVVLRVYDLQGRVVRTLVDGEQEAGSHSARWDGRDDTGRGLEAGMYFVRLWGEAGTSVRRTILVR